MIFLFEYGRLGNQIFQYCGLRTLYPKDYLFLVGFNSLFDVINTNKTFHLSTTKSFYWNLFYRTIRFILNIELSNVRIFTRITENISIDNKSEIHIENGLIPFFKYAEFVHFESEKYINLTDEIQISINNKYLKNANEYINRFKVRSPEYKLIFIHVRRGDYLTEHTIRDIAFFPVLRIEWYRRAVEEFRGKYKNCKFVVMTDDEEYVQKEFTFLPDLFMSKGSEGDDFALMSFCDGGILSSSTFSWWGSFFGSMNNPNNEYIAPLYWRGNSIKIWEPHEDIKTSWINYLTV